MKKTILLLTLTISLQMFSQEHILKESIFFALGKTDLSTANKHKLDSLITIMNASKTYHGDITGHTCSIGSLSINKVISNLRALNVFNYLVDKGLNPKYLTHTGMAGAIPLGDNKTKKGRGLNRRADVKVVFALKDEIENASTNPKNTSTSTTISNPNTTTNSTSNTSPTNTTNNTTTTNSTTTNTNTTSVKPTTPDIAIQKIGPNFVNGNIPAIGNKQILSTNGIVLDIDKNSLVTNSKNSIELDIKDYTNNFDVIKKGLQTKSNGNNLKLQNAFSINFTQDYQEVPLNTANPVIVTIPNKYDPSLKLYSNHKNWQLDTINQMKYNYEKKAYEIKVINNSQMIGLLKPFELEDTMKYLRVKIKGVDPENIQPYVIYDDCSIAKGVHLKRKFFLFPIGKVSEKYALRAQYNDYSSKTPSVYSLNYDIVDLSPNQKIKKYPGYNDVIILCQPKYVEMKNEKLPLSSLCDSPVEITK